MEMLKKSVVSLTLTAMMLCFIPSTNMQAKSYSLFGVTLKDRQLAVAIVATITPLILLHKQDILPDVIKNNVIFKTLIGTPERDEKYEFVGFDKDNITVKRCEKQPSTGLLGAVDAYLKPYKKAKDNWDVIVYIVGFLGIVNAIADPISTNPGNINPGTSTK